LYDGESPDDPIKVSSNGFKYPNGEFVYDGAILFSGYSSFMIGGKAASDFKEGSSRDIELERLDKSRAGLWELTSDNNIDSLTLLETSAVYFQRYGSNDIAMCYLFPCLSMTDELYIKWNNHVNACLESSEDCISLSADIEQHARDKLVFRTDNKILSIKQGEYDFFFNNDIDLVVFSEEDGEEPFFVKELSLEYDYDATVKKVRLDANNKEYSFIGMSSDLEGLKPKLEFLVKEYEPSS
nr:hypothetical protein [Nanoarchaeota archaeon]